MKKNSDHEQLSAYLKEHHIESVFNEELKPYLTLYRFNPGELICRQGEPFEVLYVLVKGKIKIHTTTAEGKALILSFKTPLEVIGDVEYIQGIEMINTVEAVSPVDMIGVHHQWIRKHSADHSPLLRFLLDIITKKFYIKSNSLSFNLMHPVEVRLASYLLSVSFETSDAFEGEYAAISLTDTANLIGTSYRHLNRVIQKFCEDGLVERSKRSILIKDRVGLSDIAGRNIYE